MPEPSDDRATWGSRLALSVLYLAAIAMVLEISLGEGVIERDPRDRIQTIVSGHGALPFQLRVCAPVAVSLIARTIPDVCVSAASAVMPQWVAEAGGGAIGVAVIVLLAAALLAFARGLFLLRREVLGEADDVRAHAETLAAIALITPFCFWSHVYDLPMLALTTWSLLAAVRRARPAFAALFLVACLTKETALLLLLPAATMAASTRRAWLDVFFGAMLGVGLGVQVLLRSVFRSSPGSLEVHFGENVRAMASMPLLDAVTVVCALASVAAARRAWPSLPPACRAALIAALPLAIAYLVGGVWGEARVFLDVYAALAIAVFVALERGTGRSDGAATGGAAPSSSR